MANEKHLYLTFGGGYASTRPALANEQWQCGIRCSLVFGDTDEVGVLPNNWDPVAASINRNETDWTITGNWTVSGPSLAAFTADDWLNDQVAPALATWFGTSLLFSSSYQLRWAKVYPIGTTGRAVPAPPFGSGTPITLTWKTPAPTGGNADQMLPVQDTPVISHRTQQIGRPGRGRIYAPGLGTGAMALGVIGSTTQNLLRDTHVTLLETIAYTRTTPDKAQVRPCVIGKPWTNYAIVTTVRVGNAMDTQRRRRRRIIETTTDASVTY